MQIRLVQRLSKHKTYELQEFMRTSLKVASELSVRCMKSTSGTAIEFYNLGWSQPIEFYNLVWWSQTMYEKPFRVIQKVWEMIGCKNPIAAN